LALARALAGRFMLKQAIVSRRSRRSKLNRTLTQLYLFFICSRCVASGAAAVHLSLGSMRLGGKNFRSLAAEYVRKIRRL
jgi:hypothetical protein